MVVNQGFVIKKFWLTRFNEANLTLFSVLGLSFGFAFMASPFLALFLLGVVVSIFVQPLFRVTVVSESVGLAVANEKGQVLGVLGSITSLGAIIGPIVAEPAYLANRHFPFILSVFIVFVAFLLLFIIRRRLLKHSAPQPDVVVV